MTAREHGGARRYYLVEQAIGIDRGIDDWIFVNKEEALPTPLWGEGYRREAWGTHAISGYVKDGPPRYIGLPRIRTTPRFILGKGKKTTIDAYVTTYLTIVSDRLKRLMEAVDPAAFEFAPVDATHGKTDKPELGPYWAYGVIRALNCVDEARSDIIYYKDEDSPTYVGMKSEPRYMSLNMARMIPEVVGDAAAFLLERRESFVIFDDRIVDAYRADKMKGFTFSPLQEPIGRERKGTWAIYISNRLYWHNRGVI